MQRWMNVLTITPRQAPLLIVDDYDDLRKTVARMLQKVGFEKVHQVADGAACIAFVSKNSVATILLDISLPGISGIEVCKYLRRIQLHRDLRLVACTAHAGPESKNIFLSAGFDDVLFKPFGLGELIAVV